MLSTSPRGRAFMLGLLVLALGTAAWRASGASAYLSEDPAACRACHLMDRPAAGWRASAHARAATCNDCHLPQGNVLRRLGAKLASGLRHGTRMAFGPPPQGLQLGAEGQEVLQANCLRCHGARVPPSTPRPVAGSRLPRPHTAFHADATRACTDCHRESPHGRPEPWSPASPVAGP